MTVPLIAPTLITAFIAGMIKSLEASIEQVLECPQDCRIFDRIFNLLRDPPDDPQAMALVVLCRRAFVLVVFTASRSGTGGDADGKARVLHRVSNGSIQCRGRPPVRHGGSYGSVAIPRSS